MAWAIFALAIADLIGPSLEDTVGKCCLLAVVVLSCTVFARLEYSKRRKLKDSWIKGLSSVHAMQLCSESYEGNLRLQASLQQLPPSDFKVQHVRHYDARGLQATIVHMIPATDTWLIRQTAWAQCRRLLVIIKGTDTRSYAGLFADVDLALREAAVVKGLDLLGGATGELLGLLRAAVLQPTGSSHPRYCDTQVFAMGHSLGGYLAQRLTWDLAHAAAAASLPLEARCFAFDCPGLLSGDIQQVKAWFPKEQPRKRVQSGIHVFLSYPNPINMLGSHQLSTIWHCQFKLDTWDRAYLSDAVTSVCARCGMYWSFLTLGSAALAWCWGIKSAAAVASKVSMAVSAAEATVIAANASAAAADAATAGGARSTTVLGRVQEYIPSLRWMFSTAATDGAVAARAATEAAARSTQAAAAVSSLAATCSKVALDRVSEAQRQAKMALVGVAVSGFGVLHMEARDMLALHSLLVMSFCVHGDRLEATAMASWPMLGNGGQLLAVVAFKALRKVLWGDVGIVNLLVDRNEIIMKRCRSMKGFVPLQSR